MRKINDGGIETDPHLFDLSEHRLQPLLFSIGSVAAAGCLASPGREMAVDTVCDQCIEIRFAALAGIQAVRYRLRRSHPSTS